jgi:hypothetical protein
MTRKLAAAAAVPGPAGSMAVVLASDTSEELDVSALDVSALDVSASDVSALRVVR